MFSQKKEPFCAHWMRLSLSGLALSALLVSSFSLEAQAVGWPSRVVQVERELSSEDPSVRVRAARALQKLSNFQVQRALTIALQDSEREVRLLAARHVVENQLPGWGQAVAPWLQETDLELRWAALAVLRFDAHAVPLVELAPLLRDSHRAVRRAVLPVVVRATREPQEERVALLRSALEDAEDEIRADAVEALAWVGGEQIGAALRGAAQDESAEVRRRALVALSVHPSADVQASLWLALRDGDVSVSRAAARGLATLGTSLSFELLRAELRRSPWTTVQTELLSAVVQFPEEEAEPLLLELLQQAEAREEVRRVIQEQGGLSLKSARRCQEGAAGELLVFCLVQLVQEEPQLVLSALQAGRVSALQVLHISQRAKELPEELLVFALTALSSAEPSVRQAALSVLQRFPLKEEAFFVPIQEALLSSLFSTEQKKTLLGLLCASSSAETGALARQFLSSTDPQLRDAAQMVLLRQNQDPPQLLIQWAAAHWDPSWAQVLAQAEWEPVLALLFQRLPEAGKSERRALRELIHELSSPLSELQIEQLLQQLWRSWGEERDAWIELLARWGAQSTQLDLIYQRGDEEDRLWLTSFATVQENERLLQLASQDPHARVRAVAEAAVPQEKSFREAEQRFLLSTDRKQQIHSLQILTRGLRRGLNLQTPEPFCSWLEDVPRFDVARTWLGLDLLDQTKLPCVNHFAQDLLLSSPVPVLREKAAQVLHSFSQEPEVAHVLRVCAWYETSPEVAAACEKPVAARVRVPGSPVSVRVQQSNATDWARSSWVIFLDPVWGYWPTWTSRGGVAVLPSAEARLESPDLW